MISRFNSIIKKQNHITYWIFIFVFSIVALELLLRVFGILETYTESIGQGYQSYFNRQPLNYYNTLKPNDTFTLDHKDFRFLYRTNELGLREMPLDSFWLKSKKGIRILAFGDSFTEGVGAPYDSTFPHFLENILHQVGTDAYVYNAGVGGSDPFFEYVLFRDKLVKTNPRLAIVAINSSDVDDYFFRGGMERFQSDGTLKSHKGPWFESLYIGAVRFSVLLLLPFAEGKNNYS